MRVNSLLVINTAYLTTFGCLYVSNCFRSAISRNVDIGTPSSVSGTRTLTIPSKIKRETTDHLMIISNDIFVDLMSTTLFLNLYIALSVVYVQPSQTHTYIFHSYVFTLLFLSIVVVIINSVDDWTFDKICQKLTHFSIRTLLLSELDE